MPFAERTLVQAILNTSKLRILTSKPYRVERGRIVTPIPIY
jgi:hypothetical protein